MTEDKLQRIKLICETKLNILKTFKFDQKNEDYAKGAEDACKDILRIINED